MNNSNMHEALSNMDAVINEGKQKRRLAIFVCYDKDGIIDDYIPVLLSALQPFLKKLVIVVNGKLDPSGRKKLMEITPHIRVRENKGYDAGAWKDALVDYLGWQEVAEYDELLLANDSFFGPLYPFEEMFAVMDARDVDFWGITAHGEANIVMPGSPYPHLMAHIQSYFMVFRHSLHTDKGFITYWEKQPYYQEMEEVIAKHETYFTQYCADLGFCWGVYVDTSDMDGKFPESCPISHCFYNTFEMIARRQCPILKRHAFGFSYQHHLDVADGMHLARTVAFISAETSYDISLIYKNVIRIYNMTDLFFNLHLSFVLPKDYRKQKTSARHRAVMVFHLFYMELLEELQPYIVNLPSYLDVILTTPAERLSVVEQCFLPVLGERLRIVAAPVSGRDFSALLVAAAPYLKNYDYIGFCHDKRSHAGTAATVGADFRALIVENTIGSGIYVENVLNVLAKRQEIGILVPPPPHHAAYFSILRNLWAAGPNFENVKKVAQRLAIHANISKEHMPLAVGSAFWCRREALEPLLDYPWQMEDFPTEPMPEDGSLNHALERIFPFVAQSQGFFTGWIMTDEYAALEIGNLHYLLIKTMNTFPAVLQVKSKSSSFVACVKKYLPRPLWGPARRVKRWLGW